MLTSVICAIIKDETEYLEEWIRHHLNIGFNHIVLYQDRNSESHDHIVKQFQDYVTLINLDDSKYDFLFTLGFLKQMTLYHMFMIEYYQKYNWVTFIDIDEYLFFAEGYDLQQLLKENQFIPSFTIQWKVIGADGKIEKCKNIVESYFKDTSEDYEFGYIPTKMFINLYDIVSLDFCHLPAIPNKKRYLYKDKQVWINHYYTKSWDDWCDRFVKKGDLCPGNRDIIEFFRINKDMLPIKNKLLERFYIKNNIKRHTCDFIHVFTPEINNHFKQEVEDSELSLSYDILAYTLSFTYLKKFKRKLKLYCSMKGKELLAHLDYDEVFIIPDEYLNIDGIINTGLLYALENEPITSCFVHGDCFLKDDIILGFLETSIEDLIVLKSDMTDKNNVWDYTINKQDCSPSFLTPDLNFINGTYDTAILKFNNSSLKEEFIKKYRENIILFKDSLYGKFCILSKKLIGDKCIFNNLLWDMVQDKFSCKEIVGVGRGFQCQKERTDEKIKFFRILHLTNKSKYFNKDECIKNMLLTLKKESHSLYELVNKIIKII